MRHHTLNTHTYTRTRTCIQLYFPAHPPHKISPIISHYYTKRRIARSQRAALMVLGRRSSCPDGSIEPTTDISAPRHPTSRLGARSLFFFNPEKGDLLRRDDALCSMVVYEATRRRFLSPSRARKIRRICVLVFHPPEEKVYPE